ERRDGLRLRRLQGVRRRTHGLQGWRDLRRTWLWRRQRRHRLAVLTTTACRGPRSTPPTDVPPASGRQERGPFPHGSRFTPERGYASVPPSGGDPMRLSFIVLAAACLLGAVSPAASAPAPSVAAIASIRSSGSPSFSPDGTRVAYITNASSS